MLKPQKNQAHITGLFYAMTTAICWSVLAILLKNALNFADSQTIVAFRMIFAFSMAITINALLYKKNFKKNLKLLKRPPLFLILGSLGLAFNYLGFMKGVEYSSASNAQIMIQLGPLFLMLSGFIIFKENLKRVQALWLLLALVGFSSFFWDQLELGSSKNLILANIWLFWAALTWVFYSLVIKHFTKKGYSAFELNLVVFLCCSLVLSFGINFDQVKSFSINQWLFLGFLGLNTLVAYGAFGQALKYAPASQVSIIITANPILTLIIITFGSGLSPFIPYEPLSILGYFGALLVLIGIGSSTLAGLNKKTS